MDKIYQVAMNNLTKQELIEIAHNRLQEKEKFESLLESLSGISWEFDLGANKFTYVSQNATELLGYTLKEWSDFASWKAMLHHDDREWVVKYCTEETQKGKNHVMEYRMFTKGGDVIWMLDAVTLSKNAQGKVVKLLGFNIDITEKKIAQEKMKMEHANLQLILDGIIDPVMIINQDYSVKLMNKVLKDSLNERNFQDAKAPKCYEIAHNRESPCEGEHDDCPLQYVIDTKESTRVLHRHQDEDGNKSFVELAASPLINEYGDCTAIIESSRDVTQYISLQRELEAKSRELEYEATHDYLTGLPNRALFMDRLEQSINDAKRHQSSVALFFMDLDHFKQINDTLGHHMGDEALKEVCKKFRSVARINDVLSRLAGDEFTVILKDVSTEEDAGRIAQKFINSLKKPILVDGHVLNLSVSIGISFYRYSSMHSYDIDFQERILREADSAMYKAKSKGKSNFQFIS